MAVAQEYEAATGLAVGDRAGDQADNIHYIEAPAPLDEPEAYAIEWAPPPLIYEDVVIAPSEDAFWIGGYWDWYDGGWAWARGRWIAPPYAGCAWNQPYYENRGGRVIYVGGFWRKPGVEFSAPATMPALANGNPSYKHGPRVIGPTGVFVPAPPGSRPGLVVAAPIGTPPRVVAGQPALIRPGMAVHADGGRFRVQAPASAVRGGQRVDSRVASAPMRSGEHVNRATPPASSVAKTQGSPTHPNLDPSRVPPQRASRAQMASHPSPSPAPASSSDARESRAIRAARTSPTHATLPGERALPQRTSSAPVRSGAERAPMTAPPGAPTRAEAQRPMTAPPEARATPTSEHAVPEAAHAAPAAEHAAPAAEHGPETHGGGGAHRH